MTTLTVLKPTPRQYATAETNVPLEAAAWMGGVGYAPGDVVSYVSDGEEWLYVAVAPTTWTPPVSFGVVQTDYWLRTNPTQRAAMWNRMVGAGATTTAAEAYDGAIYAVEPVVTPTGIAMRRWFDRATAFGLTGVEGDYVDVKVHQQVDHALIYSQRVPLVAGVANTVLLDGLPWQEPQRLDPDPYMLVSIGTSEVDRPARCSVALYGETEVVGTVLHGSGLQLVDYSERVTDAFGNITVVERRWTPNVTLTVRVDDANRVQRLLARYRARPLMWFAAGATEGGAVYGYWRDMRLTPLATGHALLDIEIGGL